MLIYVTPSLLYLSSYSANFFKMYQWYFCVSFLQVVLTVSQLMWCCDLTQCLEGEDHDHLQALNDFEKINFDVSFGIK